MSLQRGIAHSLRLGPFSAFQAVLRTSCARPAVASAVNMSSATPPVETIGTEEVPTDLGDSCRSSGETQEKPRPDWPWKRSKKVALMLSFYGKDYMGMQRNKGFKTIEEELLRALKESGSIPGEWSEIPQKAFFQRASRTDKGVSALKMVVSLKMLHEDSTIPKLNSFLPSDIRVQAIKRVTKNFNSKNSCDGRTYIYLTPTFAFCPIEEVTTEDYRIDRSTIDKVNSILKKFIGSHYFHNYTSGKVPLEPSSQRVILSFSMDEPFVRDGMEFAVITVKGQSFMLHQIRKMIGMTIAVVRGHAEESRLDEAWGEDRIHIPRAPGLGLMLDEVHYEQYNRKFGHDGIHERLSWTEDDAVADEVARFKEDMVFADVVRTEREEKSMMEWLATLFLHNFEETRHFEAEDGDRSKTPQDVAMGNVNRLRREMQKEGENIGDGQVAEAVAK